MGRSLGVDIVKGKDGFVLVHLVGGDVAGNDLAEQTIHENKVKYEQYFTHLGPAYANMYLHAILMMRMVEYNQEFEDRLKELDNE